MCVCPGDCEGGPECLDDEGGPLPEAEVPRPSDANWFPWACTCGKGGVPNFRNARDPADAQAEMERQVLAHLREEGHDRMHTVYIGRFTESLCIDTQPPHGVLGRKAGDELDWVFARPHLS